MEGIILIVVGLGFFVAVIVWAFRYSKKINARKAKYFTELAQKHSLEHSSTKHMMAVLNDLQGTWNGYPIHIHEKMVGSGKNKSVVTYAVFKNVPFDYDFKIGKEHIFSKAGKMLGLKDIEFQDAEFDKKFLIKAKDEDKFRAFFNYKLQEELKMIKDNLKATIRVQNGTMTYSHHGPLPNEKVFKSFESVVGFMFKMLNEADNRRS